MTADYETKAWNLLTADELPLIGSPCRCCQRPLTAVDVFHRNTICGGCESGENGFDRRPAMATLAIALLPLLACGA
jgi:hypothetical protein